MMKALLDLDGVLVDFVSGMCASHGREDPFENGHRDYYLEQAWDMSLEEFWSPAQNAEWWAELPKYPVADLIVDLVERYIGQENVCILTSPIDHGQCLAGKVAWIERHYPQYARRYLIGPEKHFCAHANAVLIDDHEYNVESFVTAGGHGILVPRQWNSAREYPLLEHLENQLENLTYVRTMPAFDGRRPNRHRDLV